MSATGRLNLSQDRLALLNRILREEGLEAAGPAGVVRRADPAAPVPATVQQTQMWTLDHLLTGPTPYVVLGALRVRGALDPAVFAHACRMVVRRHESLRTVLVDIDGRPVQQVRADLPPDVAVHHPITSAPLDMDDEIHRRLRDLATQPFDLATGPLLRVHLLCFAPDAAAVLLAMHHVVSDMWSMGVLMREVGEVYAAATVGREPRLTSLQVQYPDFALWQRGEGAEAIDEDLAYWRGQLADLPPDTGLLTDRPRPAERTSAGASVPLELSPELTAAVRHLARAEGATPFMVFAATFAVLLGRWGGTDDVVMGTPVAGRARAELEPLVGYFANTLTLRADLSGDPTFRDLVGRVQATCLDAFDHQAAPFDRVVEELRPERTLSRNPLFQVMFSYQNAPMPSWDSGPVRLEPIPVSAATAKFDLQLDLFEDGPAVWGRLVYSTDLFDAAHAEGLAASWTRLVQSLVVNPGRHIDDVPLLSPARREAVLALGRGPKVDPPPVDRVEELILAHARAHPDDIAVVAADGRLSYGDLDRRSGAVARRLAVAGVRPGSLVALHLPAGADLVVALVAVWRAGAAYVPLDPEWSPERRDLVLDDAAAAAVLARGPDPDAGPGPAVRPWVRLDDDETDLGDSPRAPGADEATRGDPAPGPGDLAYVMYTSGSTGRPKGVLVTHAGLLSPP